MLNLLKPYKIDSPKIRLGQKSDGGYVINEVAINESKYLFTYGVGGDTGYENDYHDHTGNDVYMFDHTNGRPASDKEGMHFRPQGLGDCDKCKDFKQHFEEFGISGPVLLKIDTEGAEYEYFLNADFDFLARVCTGIIIEFHWLHEPPRRIMAKKIFKELSKHFYLTHIHGNNWVDEFAYDGFAVPIVMELSYVNKTLVDKAEYDLGNFPTDLDYPNNANLPDRKILFHKHV